MKKVLLFIFVLVLLAVLFFSYQSREAKILFVGDMFFDRYIRLAGYNKGEDFIFSCIDNFLKDSDLVVGNLEGPITDNPSTSLGTAPGAPDNFIFTFPIRTAKLLAKNNIKLVNLGNNHIGNFGQAGISSTKKYLEEAGVNYIYDNIYRTKIGSTDISFVSYNEFGGESAEKVAEKIADEKNNGRAVFVYAHWGDEYADAPVRVKNTAKLFAQKGADFIIGSHPHVILPSETLRLSSGQETIVYYSLGNFIFDQYWSKEVSTGLLLETHISKGKISVTEHKVSLNRNGQTCLVN